MILFSFPLGGFVDEVVDNGLKYQGYKYVYFLQYHALTVIHFIKVEQLVRLPEKIFLMHTFV